VGGWERSAYSRIDLRLPFGLLLLLSLQAACFFKTAKNQAVRFAVLADIGVFIPVLGEREEHGPDHHRLFSGKTQMTAMMLIAAAIGEIQDFFLVVHDVSILSMELVCAGTRRVCVEKESFKINLIMFCKLFNR
jgi:hypothetical protein